MQDILKETCVCFSGSRNSTSVSGGDVMIVRPLSVLVSGLFILRRNSEYGSF